MDWMLGAGMALSAVFAALGGVLILAASQAGQRQCLSGFGPDTSGEACFLFDGDALVDATPNARTMLALAPQAGTALARLTAWLGPRFPGVEDRLAALAVDGRFLLAGDGDRAPDQVLQGEQRGGLTRLTLTTAGEGLDAEGLDALSQHALEQELGMLRDTLAQAPMLVWRENAADEVVWANTRYLQVATVRLAPDADMTWPLPRLFETPVPGKRHRLDRNGPGAEWFDLSVVEQGTGRLMFALPANAAQQAEVTLREFMQTLTKTFAHLPIGLAIFDRQRHLQLFNPALMDLSGLPPDFLSMRPSLFAFLDAMRDRNTIPEPQDYHGWRRQMTELEEAAASGVYEETWNLPSGQTYNVIGRPHPNGALALMFEDISTEMSRNRRYRADLELGQSVIDAMAEAIAVFSQSGQLVMSNAAYTVLWGHDPSATLGEAGIGALCAYWRGLSAPSPFWAEAEAFVATLGRRGTCAGDVRLADGRLVACQFRALQGGAALASFRPVAVAAKATDPIPQAWKTA